jgi:methylated-DNA-[protein]-cysteine S-methyltransferase
MYRAIGFWHLEAALEGFKGSWGRIGKEGLNDAEKRGLLREEGIKFDGSGRVIGFR